MLIRLPRLEKKAIAEKISMIMLYRRRVSIFDLKVVFTFNEKEELAAPGRFI